MSRPMAAVWLAMRSLHLPPGLVEPEPMFGALPKGMKQPRPVVTEDSEPAKVRLPDLPDTDVQRRLQEAIAAMIEHVTKLQQTEGSTVLGEEEQQVFASSKLAMDDLVLMADSILKRIDAIARVPPTEALRAARRSIQDMLILVCVQGLTHEEYQIVRSQGLSVPLRARMDIWIPPSSHPLGEGVLSRLGVAKHHLFAGDMQFSKRRARQKKDKAGELAAHGAGDM